MYTRFERRVEVLFDLREGGGVCEMCTWFQRRVEVSEVYNWFDGSGGVWDVYLVWEEGGGVYLVWEEGGGALFMPPGPLVLPLVEDKATVRKTRSEPQQTEDKYNQKRVPVSTTTNNKMNIVIFPLLANIGKQNFVKFSVRSNLWMDYCKYCN